MIKPKFKSIDTMVARDLGDGYIKVTIVIDTKIHEYKVRKSVAVGMITSLAQALDGNLHDV